MRASRTPGRRFPVAIALFVFAWALRWLALSGDPYHGLFFNVFYHGDADRFLGYASAIMSGETSDSGLPFRPPLLGWVLAALEPKIRAGDFSGIKAVLLFLNAFSIPLLWAIGKRAFGELAGVVAALLAAASFSQIVFATSLNVESLYVPLLLVSILYSVIAVEGGRPRDLVIAGLAGGLGSLLRAEHFLLVVLMALWVVAARWRANDESEWIPSWPEMGRRFRPLAWVAGAALLLILPWSVRNFFSIGAYNREHRTVLAEPLPRFSLVTQYGPFNFALANSARANGVFDPSDPDSGEEIAGIDLENPRHLDLYLNGYRHGFRYLFAHPREAARLAGQKLVLTADGFSHGFLGRNWPAGLVGVRRPVDIFVPSKSWLEPVWMVLGLVGLVVAWRRNRAVTLLLIVVILHRLLVTVLFFGYARGGALLVPLVALFIGALAARLAAAAGGGEEVAQGGTPARALAGLAIALLIAQAILATSPVRLEATGSAFTSGGALNPDAEVKIHPLSASR